MTESVSKNAFEGDALNCSELGRNIVRLIYGLQNGVIAIDGAWGSGKTWFGMRSRDALSTEPKIRTIWIDTFSADWQDDPALTLLAEFSQQLPENKREAFISSVTPLVGKIAVAAGKAGLNAFGNFVGLDAKTVGEVVDVAQGVGEAYIKKRIEELAERKKSLAAMKELLQRAMSEEVEKIVVFVDELDRCSPAYAIRFLERIKHLFDAPGVVFVLLWNREQIQQAVKAFYGIGTDGQMYLDRFVDYPILLPNHNLAGRVEAMGMIVQAEIKLLTGQKQSLLLEGAKVIGTFGDVLELTAREIKHVCAWWVMSPARMYDQFELWLLCFKVKRPDIYKGLQLDSKDAHELAERLVLAGPPSPAFQPVLNAIQRLHQTCRNKDIGDFGAFSKELFGDPMPDIFSVTRKTISRLECLKQ